MIQWYISRCQLGRDGVYLAALAWQDGLNNPEITIPPPKHPYFILIV
jgi:hypothetical protein